MTGAPQLRPAAGWLARRLTEFASDAATTVTARSGGPDGPRGPDGAPTVPPRRLRARVGAPRASDYLEGGRHAADALVQALSPHPADAFASVLDFGCGPGRVLSHLAHSAARTADCTGVDVDAAAIAWAQSHLPGISFARSGARPPLAFDAASFGLVYSISVFSHLDEPAQDAWLAELARITRPGGSVLLSTHGASALEAFRSGEVRTTWCDPRAFARRGPLGVDELVAVPYRPSRWSRGDLPGVGEGYGLSFHGSDYIRAHWGRFLKVEAILPRAISGWQDLVVATAPA